MTTAATNVAASGPMMGQRGSASATPTQQQQLVLLLRPAQPRQGQGQPSPLHPPRCLCVRQFWTLQLSAVMPSRQEICVAQPEQSESRTLCCC